MAVKEAPHGARRERSAMFPAQQIGNLAQRDVDLRLDRREDDAAISLDALGAAITTLALRGLLAGLTSGTHPTDGTRR